MNQDCPTCREPMAWKYLKEPRCFKCNPEIKSELTPTTSTIKASNDMTDASRAEFEKWAQSQGRTTGTLNGITYFDPFVSGLWQAWQAARASVVIELPATDTRMLMVSQAIKAIESAGCTVSVKP